MKPEAPATTARARPRGPAILCYDGSQGAGAAIEHAGVLLGGGNAIVLNVVESLAPAVFHAGTIAGRSGTARSVLHVPGVEAGRLIAEEGCERARRAGFVPEPLVDVTPGNPSHRIVALADEYDAAVIVVGARGASTLKAILLGSVSHETVQHANRPVLVVHARGD